MSCHVPGFGFTLFVEPFGKLHRFRLRDFQGEEAGIVLCVVDVVGATHTKSPLGREKSTWRIILSRKWLITMVSQ